MATLRETVEAHGFSHDCDQGWDEHAIPGICLRRSSTPLADPCFEGRTVVEVEQYSDRWYVTSMALEDLLPVLGLAVAAGYGADCRSAGVETHTGTDEAQSPSGTCAPDGSSVPE